MPINWRSRLRLLPLTLAASTALVGLKVVDIWQGGRLVGVPSATAETAARSPVSKAATGAPTPILPASVAAPPPPVTASAAPPTRVAEAEPPKPGPARVDDKAKVSAAPKVAVGQPSRDPGSYTASEIEVLQSLVKRRESLDQREREMGIREGLLAAAEKRIEARLAELKKLETKLTALADTHDEEEERRLKGLVKVYENMKPPDAARIFQELEMPVLLDVAERMREAKLAPILAQMNPLKATEVTVELARRHEPPEMPAAAADPAAPPKPGTPAAKADAAPQKGKPG